jgi:hypothetical protein
MFIKFAQSSDEKNNRNQNSRNGRDHRDLSDLDLCQSVLIFVFSQLCEMEPSFSQIANKDHFTKMIMRVVQRMLRFTHTKAVEIAEVSKLTETGSPEKDETESVCKILREHHRKR